MTRNELVQRLQELPNGHLEVLVGSWDGCTDAVGSVGIDTVDSKNYVIIGANGWEYNA